MRCVRPRSLIACACLVVGCDRRSDAPITRDQVVPAKDAAPPVARPTWPAGAPNPEAPCKTHDECTVLVVVPGANPCCTHQMFRPVSRAYADSFHRFHDENCKGAECPAEPLPGPEPSCCASIGRCVNHKCVAGCDDPTLDVPDVVWLDSACRWPTR